MKTSLNITKADFMNGMPASRCGCPVALALMRQAKIRVAHVFPEYAFLEFVDGTERTIALSKQLQKIVAKFDKIDFPEKMRVDPRSKFEAVSVELDITPIDLDPFRLRYDSNATPAAPSARTAQPAKTTTSPSQPAEPSLEMSLF